MSKMLERAARALCQSCKFETGQGGCAPLCMSVLGDSRGGPHGCPHAAEVHQSLAAAVIDAIGPDPRIAAAKVLADADGWDGLAGPTYTWDFVKHIERLRALRAALLKALEDSE